MIFSDYQCLIVINPIPFFILDISYKGVYVLESVLVTKLYIVFIILRFIQDQSFRSIIGEPKLYKTFNYYLLQSPCPRNDYIIG